MDEPLVSKRDIIITGLFSIIIIGIIYCTRFSDSLKNKVVFCDVGQGDAIYIQINPYHILIDTGPERGGVLDCLENQMPLFHKKIDYIFLTHPQTDHIGGLDQILDRYTISHIYMLPLYKEDETFKKALQNMQNKHIKISYPSAPNHLMLPHTTLHLLWPTKPFLNTNISFFTHKPLGLGLPISDENILSFIIALETPKETFFFTGDASSNEIKSALSSFSRPVTVFKLPHHGSSNAISRRVLALAGAREGVISVGKKNKYGHPSPKTLDILKALDIRIRRTDEEGMIVYEW